MTTKEMLKQVKLLLRRNLALHMRQPVILVLELLWPILIFLVVMAARNAIPPVAQPTCYYKAWALPSAGVVPFFQSMICNIDDCQNASDYEDIPTYPSSSVRQLVENTMPLITDKAITELVEALPKGMKLVRVAVDALSGPDLSALLGNGFPVRNLLKDNNETRNLLLKQNISLEDIDILFNSSIQLPQILEILNEKTFCDSVQEIQAANSNVFEKLRTSICHGSESERREFFLQLKNQLNVKNIVQTMGLAMSELGRLDISEILKNIGGLLSSVQSSDIISTDILSVMSTVLSQIKFENVDTEIVPLLVNDLEPLYRHSQWAGLINILKDIRFPRAESRLDRYQGNEYFESPTEWHLWKEKHKALEYSNQMKRSDFKNDSMNILGTVLELTGTVMDVVRLMPQQNTTKVQNALKYFNFLVDISDEITNSLKKDNSSKFLDNLADILGAAFLNIAGPSVQEKDHLKAVNWCDKKEVRKILKSPTQKNLENLQEYACRISKVAAKDFRKNDDKERWRKASDKMKHIFNIESLMQMEKNILSWEKEIQPTAKPSSHQESERPDNEKINDVEDFIIAAECSVEGFKKFLEPVIYSKNSSEKIEKSGIETQQGRKGEIEKMILSYVFGTKTMIQDLKGYFLNNVGNFTGKDAGNVLNAMNRVLTDFSEHNATKDVSVSMDLVRFLPRLIAVIQNFNSSAEGFIDIPEFVSAFIEDLEPVIWKSITSEEARLFSLESESEKFCIAPETLHTSKAYLHSLACGNEDNTTFRLMMPSGNKMKQVNSVLLSNFKIAPDTFDTQTFSRILLQLRSGSGYMLKVLMHFMKSIEGCASSCASNDMMLKKMCFLGRLHNIKSVIHKSDNENGDYVSQKDNDILMCVNSVLVLNFKIAPNTFDTLTFIRILLQRTYGSGYMLKVLMHFMKFIEGCASSCASNDMMIKKMCFLGRLHNIKSVIHKSDNGNSDYVSHKDNDILMQLKPLLGIDDDIVEAYQSFMEVVEVSAASNYSDYKDIVRLIVSGVRLMESFDDNEHKMRPALHVVNSLISLLRNRVADTALYNSTSVVEIQNVFPGSPLTQDVVRSLLPVLPELTSTFFWTALAPGQFLHLVSENNRNVSVILSKICSAPMATYFYNPSLDNPVLENLKSIICRHKYYDVFEEIFQDPDIQEIVFEADNTDEIAWDETIENVQDIISLLTYLGEVRKADLGIIPPLPKWQMMAIDIYSHLKNPNVVLYIINNKLFSDFCFKPLANYTADMQNLVSKNSQIALYAELCSMSKQTFASNLVHRLNETVHNSVKNSAMGPNAVGMAFVKDKFWEALLNVPEIKNIAKMVFDVDVVDALKHEKSDKVDEMGRSRRRFSKKFVEKLMNATQKAFDMADSMTNKRLSAILMGTSIPELAQDFAAFVEESDGVVNVNRLVDKGSGFEKLFKSLLQEDMERRKLESYIQTLSRYFSKKKHGNHLIHLCNSSRNKGNLKPSDYTGNAVCTLNPRSWSIQYLVPDGNIYDAWQQIEKILDDGTKNKTRNMFFEKRKKEFMHSINRTLLTGIHVSEFSSLQKSSFYFALLKSFVRNLNGVEPNKSVIPKQICVTKNTEVAFQESIHKLLDSIPNAEFMTCGLLSKNISSFYAWVSKTAGVKRTIEKVSAEINNKKPCSQSWNWLLKSIDDLEKLYNKFAQNLPKKAKTRISYCIGNFTHSPLMYSLQAHANVLKQVTKLLTGLTAPTGQWKEMREKISQRISQHLPVFLKISDVMSNQTSWLLDFSGTDMKILKESSLNFNWLSRHGFSSSALKKRLCSDESFVSLSSVFAFPPRTPLTVRMKTRNFLCNNGTIDEVLETLDTSSIKDKVLQLQEKEFFSGKWLQKLLGSTDVLVKIVEHMGSSLKEVEIHNIYNVFQLFTKPQVLQNLADSMKALMEVLDPVFAGSSLIDTLQQVMDGLKAFRSLTQLANFTFVYTVRDVFGQKARTVLIEEMKLDPETVSHILSSEIDLKQASVNKDGKVSFCRSNSDPSPICTLSLNKKTAITKEFLQDLVLQRFLYSFGTLGIEGVLREADVDAEEAGRTLEVLSSAPTVVNRLTNHLETVTSVMHPEIKELFGKLDQGVDWLATNAALSIGGQILCGKPLTSLSKKFSLLAPEDSENKIEEKELLRLPTDFCRYGYKEIMKMRSGAILWGFLKPLFRGKILYAPKSYSPGLTIISKVNETLEILDEHIKFVKAAAEGSTGLHYVQRKSETLLSLQKFLASKSVSKLLGSPSWGSALSWLESTNTSTRSLLTLVELVGNVTECISLDRFIGFDTEAELEAAAATLHDRREFIAAIVFLEEKDSDPTIRKRSTRRQYRKLPPYIHYKIRMDIDNVPTTEYIKYRWWRPYPYDDFFEDLRYFRGFIQLQDTVDTAIMSLQSESSQIPKAKKYLQQFPYPCHQRDKFGTLLKGSMPAVMTISWVFIVAFLVREKVLDRELELDMTLRVMGLKQSAGWLAWFLTGLTVLLVSVIGIVAVLKWGGITPLSNPVILFLFVADFAVLLIAYCHLMSSFFSRATTAALMSVLLYVLSFFPFLLFVTWELDFLYWQKLLSCVLVSTSFCFGCLYLNRYEDQGQGVQWSNMWHSPVIEDRMNFGTTLVTMALCSLFYFLVSWYITRVWTGRREKRPWAWYFLFMPYTLRDKTVPIDDEDYRMKSITRDGSSRRRRPLPRIVGISMKGVHALYSQRGSKEWKALCGLNLDFYEDQITALLGHNGAGKTTTLKVLTGRILPTAGTVTVSGFLYPDKISQARKHIGFCPQNNTLYDKLTVREHLYLFAQLKGLLPPEQVEEDVNNMLESLNLVEKQDEPSDTLSGGQRRRLCVGIAFVGGSKVVILDEPTSSVDPVARRGIWDLILSYKKGRTILLTTHHLDEADILSDRVAILHKGRLLCCGSPLYLKCRFGSGYRLSLFPGTDKSEDKDSGHDTASIKSEEQPNVDCDGVMDFIQTYIPDATLLENDDTHMVVSLPAEPLSSKPLSPFFGHLERSLHTWGFQSCSLSSATLDEVFLTLCRLEDAKAAHHSSEKFTEVTNFSFRRNRDLPPIYPKSIECHKDHLNALAVEVHIQSKDNLVGTQSTSFTGLRLKFNQLKSLIKKRYWHTKRNWKTLTSSIIMPCIFIALAMGLAVGRPQKSPDPSIELKPSLYATPEQKTVSFFAWRNSEPHIGNKILDIIEANRTHGKLCLNDHAKCYIGSHKSNSHKSVSPAGSRCLCENECPLETLHSLPFLEARHQILYNLTGKNIPKYLLDSYLQFNEKRYGGWSISGESEDPDVKVWFENSGYHSAPSYLNTVNNALLKNATLHNYGIRTWSHPLRLSVEQLGRETLLERLGEVGIAFVFLIGLSLIPSTFAVYIVGERESEQKRLQMVTGNVGPLLYWTAALLWDLTIVLTTSVMSAAIVAAFALPAFYERENFRAVYTLVFLYGWATTPLTYLCCRFFREGSLAFMVLFTSHLFVGLVIMLSLVSLRMISVTKDVAVTLSLLQRFSLAFPQYSLVGGLTDLNENQIRAEIFAQFGQDVYVSPFGWNSLGPNYVALFLQGVLFFILTVVIEMMPLKHWVHRMSFKQKPRHQESFPTHAENTLLQIQNVSQVYRCKSGNKYALNDLSLKITQGECFGLVGANGAGKTTLFRLLIGEDQPISGRILRTGLQCKAIPKHCFLGYCPQKDALDGLLTPRQHLEVYAGLRGIESSQINKVVERSLQSLELNVHADFPVNSLSGGTKRKLCTAIANLGDPELILLDEPTSGMDPATRRLVWRCISRATEAGRSVVLTSHSIEDCDVLCTKLGIMVNGRIACLDSPVKLKARLGTGYTMSFRIPEGRQDWSSIHQFIYKNLPFAKLQVRSGRRIEMSLPDENVTLASLFCYLEECAEKFGIEDLAIDPTTLDQVFVNFVRQQSDATQRHCAEAVTESSMSDDETVDCTKL